MCAIFRRQLQEIRQRQSVSRGTERRLLRGVSTGQPVRSFVVVSGAAVLPTPRRRPGAFTSRSERDFAVLAGPRQLLCRTTERRVHLDRHRRYETFCLEIFNQVLRIPVREEEIIKCVRLGHFFDLSGSRDGIDDVIIRSAMGHFLLVGNWYQVSNSNRFRDICI